MSYVFYFDILPTLLESYFYIKINITYDRLLTFIYKFLLCAQIFDIIYFKKTVFSFDICIAMLCINKFIKQKDKSKLILLYMYQYIMDQ